MIIKRGTINNCHLEEDTVIVIDVLRAFTTAAFAFSRGPERIALVSTIEDAFQLRDRFSGALLMGEDHGRPVEGFDYGNSPSRLLDQDLTGKTIILRTSAGTQGVVRSKARNILATGLCTVSVTVDLIKKLKPASLTLVETAVLPDWNGDDDTACGDLIEAQLTGKTIATSQIHSRVRESSSGVLFTRPDHPYFPSGDLAAALDIDRFDFAMRVHRIDDVQFLMKES